MGTDRSRSIEASDRILTRYQGEGYQFVTIPQMMESSGQLLALSL